MLSMSHCIPDPITVAARFDGIAIMTYTITTHMSNHYNKHGICASLVPGMEKDMETKSQM